MKIFANNYSFQDIGKINVIVGKNGCGKSTCLRSIEENSQINPDQTFAKSYISPERGGLLKHNNIVEQNVTSNRKWIDYDRRKNITELFKHQSMFNFKLLFTDVLWRLNEAVGKLSETELSKLKFNTYLDQINSLLDQIVIEPSGDASFNITNKSTKTVITPDNISSGEAELISISIECLAFEAIKLKHKTIGLLILDEPDVHLHPDLQQRLMKFLMKICDRSNIKIFISTHSSAILSALADYNDAKIYFMKYGDTQIKFRPITEAVKSMLPVFGAHPLTSVFHEAPIFLVEGTDEERIWQQAVRTSQGKLKIFPVVSGDVTALGIYEREASTILASLYDNAMGYSMRDGDTVCADIDNLNRIVRFRLHCYASENLMLTNEVLASAGTNWDSIKDAIDSWINSNPSHQYKNQMIAFKNSGYDRQKQSLKEIRNILASFISNKAWEVVVGQTLGNIELKPTQTYNSDGSIYTFLGQKTCEELYQKQ